MSNQHSPSYNTLARIVGLRTNQKATSFITCSEAPVLVRLVTRKVLNVFLFRFTPLAFRLRTVPHETLDRFSVLSAGGQTNAIT